MGGLSNTGRGLREYTDVRGLVHGRLYRTSLSMGETAFSGLNRD